MQQVIDALQVAGLVLAGLTLYTLVALVVLAVLGFRYEQFKQRRVAQPVASADPTEVEELVAA